MKVTAYLINGGFTDWQEPDSFNFSVAVQAWRSMGFIQSPTFYINMNAVAIIVAGDQSVKMPLPPGATMQ